MGGVGSGDKLARGGHSATWGPLNVSDKKWEQAFGKTKSKKEKDNAKKKTSRIQRKTS